MIERFEKTMQQEEVLTKCFVPSEPGYKNGYRLISEFNCDECAFYFDPKERTIKVFVAPVQAGDIQSKFIGVPFEQKQSETTNYQNRQDNIKMLLDDDLDEIRQTFKVEEIIEIKHAFPGSGYKMLEEYLGEEYFIYYNKNLKKIKYYIKPSEPWNNSY